MFADGREVLFQKLRAVENLLKTRGYRVAVNSPFAGAMTTPVNIRYTALMIEINKKLYLPEAEIFCPRLYRGKATLTPRCASLARNPARSGGNFIRRYFGINLCIRRRQARPRWAV